MDRRVIYYSLVHICSDPYSNVENRCPEACQILFSSYMCKILINNLDPRFWTVYEYIIIPVFSLEKRAY